MARARAHGSPASAGGFSLMELLLAMSLFSLVSIGLVALLSRASDFLTTGQSSSDTLDALQTFSEAFSADVETLYTVADCETGRPDVRLFSDHVDCDVDGDEKPDARMQRLFFVRLIPREATAAVTRYAGTQLNVKGVLDQVGDIEESDEHKLRATGGLQEVFWATVPDSVVDTAVTTLYRGFRSPIGGPESLFPTGAFGDPGVSKQERGPADRKEIVARARPIMSGVLYFGVQFWSRRTNTWDTAMDPRNGGALSTWDSTRGILRTQGNRERYTGFFLAKGPESTDDPTDDTFPRRVRVTLAVEPVGSASISGFLRSDLTADGKVIDLEDARFVPATDTAERHVKIGSEWIRFEAIEGNQLTGCTRGVRGTTAEAHLSGSRVHHGRTVVRDYTISTFRDTYQDDLPAFGGRR